MNHRLLLTLLGVAAYALLSHALMLHAADAPWAVAALFGPLLMPVLALAWKRGHAPLLGAALLAAVAIVLVVAAGGLGDVKRLYVLQHAGVHVALGLVFLTSLRGGGPALITQLARRLHRTLSPAMEAYTVQVTRLWVGYFLGMALLSVLVFLTLPWAAWSLLANLLTPLAIAAVFVGEHVARYRLHPEFERVSLADAARAFSRREAAR